MIYLFIPIVVAGAFIVTMVWAVKVYITCGSTMKGDQGKAWQA